MRKSSQREGLARREKRFEDNLNLTTSTYHYSLLVPSSRRKHADLTPPHPHSHHGSSVYTEEAGILILILIMRVGARKPEKGSEGHHSWKQMSTGQDAISWKEAGGAWSGGIEICWPDWRGEMASG